jgi:1-acyl-sn-glycerol-3-phosphate acyltransferase
MAGAGRLPGDAMQEIVFDDKYEFIPPHRGNLWPWMLERVVGWRLRRQFGITGIEVRGVDRLKASIEAGDGIIVAPNHCRPSDPAVLGEIAVQAGCHVFGIASWNVFKVNAFQTFLVRRLGGFSIYREGMDRAALNCAIGILEKAERPLVVFPEGMISRTNDHLNVLQNGVSLMARSAARKRASADPAGRVVVHPVAVKYRFDGEIESSVSAVLSEIEDRLSWQSQEQRPLLERVERVGQALLTLKELEYLGAPQDGSIFDRRDRLIDSVLGPLEEEWCGGLRDEGAVARVKRLRVEILPDMVEHDLSEQERQRRWRQLADCYLAQQLSLYPIDYIGPDRPVERILETVERFEEDLADVATVHGPMTVFVEVGEAIEVSAERSRGSGGDPLMQQLETELQRLISGLAVEIDQARLQAAGREESP